MPTLHSRGIRSIREIEEAYHNANRLREFKDENGSIFWLVGLTNECKGIKYAFLVNEDGDIVSLDAVVPSVEEFKKLFCE